MSRLDAAGERHQLSLGAIRPASRTEEVERSTPLEIAIDAGRREPLVPDEPVVLRFSLTPGPTLLRRGDTLRLELASRIDLLRRDPSEGCAPFDMPVPPYPCRNTVHFGGASWVEVTEVPVATACAGNLRTRCRGRSAGRRGRKWHAPTGAHRVVVEKRDGTSAHAMGSDRSDA